MSETTCRRCIEADKRAKSGETFEHQRLVTAAQAPDIEALAKVLAEHRLVWENDGGDYGGRSWFECSCDADNVLKPSEYATEAEHEAHVAAAVLAAGSVRPEDVAEAQADDFYEGEGLPLATAESDALWGVIGRYRIGLGESILRIVGRIVRHRVAEARAKALYEARDALYRGEGPDMCQDSDIVYGEWLSNRADRAAALRPVDAPEGGASRG